MNSNAQSDLEYVAPSWDYIESMTVQLYQQIKKDNYYPEIMAGISRGGLTPSRILSDLYRIEKKKITLGIMQIGFYAGIKETQKEPIIYQDLVVHIHGKKILLVDDVADTGESLEFAVKYLKMKKPAEIKIATLYYKPWSKIKPDYYVDTTEAWVVFPHERYEFMSEQIRKHDFTLNEAKIFFKEKVGIPENSIDQFLAVYDDVILNNRQKSK